MNRRPLAVVRPFSSAWLALSLLGGVVSPGHAAPGGAASAPGRPAGETPAVAAARAALGRQYSRLEAAFQLRDKVAVERAVRDLLAPGFTSDLPAAAGEPKGDSGGRGGHAQRFVSWVLQGGAATPSPTVSFRRILDLSARAHVSVDKLELDPKGATVDVTFDIRKGSRGTLAAGGAAEEVWANGVRFGSVQRHLWVRGDRGWKLRRVQVLSATASSSLFPAPPSAEPVTPSQPPKP